MASAILSSAKHGAYLAIGLYVTMVLVITLGTQYQGFLETSLQASRALMPYGHQASSAAVEHGAAKGAAGV
jgi:hypothetical protein